MSLLLSLSFSLFSLLSTEPTDVYFVFLSFVIIIANLLILSLWTGLTQISWERTVVSTDNLGRTVETSGSCSYDGSLPYVVALIIVNLGALLFAIYEAYQARNISTEFAESEYIMKAVVSMLLVCFIGLPVVMIAEEQVARLFTFTGIIFVISMSLLGLIFVPKIKFHLDRHTDRTSSDGTSSANSGSVGSVYSSPYSSAGNNGRKNLNHQHARNPIYRDFGMEIVDRSNSLKRLEIENVKLRKQLNRQQSQRTISSNSLSDEREQQQRLEYSPSTTQQSFIMTLKTIPQVMMESSDEDEIENVSSSNEITVETTIGMEDNTGFLEEN